MSYTHLRCTVSQGHLLTGTRGRRGSSHFSLYGRSGGSMFHAGAIAHTHSSRFLNRVATHRTCFYRAREWVVLILCASLPGPALDARKYTIASLPYQVTSNDRTFAAEKLMGSPFCTSEPLAAICNTKPAS